LADAGDMGDKPGAQIHQRIRDLGAELSRGERPSGCSGILWHVIEFNRRVDPNA